MLVVLDMGGVVVRGHNVGPALSSYLGIGDTSGLSQSLGGLLALLEMGRIGEDEFWARSGIPGAYRAKESLLGKFFQPCYDQPTVEVIKRLRKENVRVVCLTNVVEAHYRYHMAHNQYEFFDKVYASHLIGCRKPDAEAFLTVLRGEEVKPDDVFFIDDSEENVKAAVSLGIKAFLYTGAGDLEGKLRELGVL